MSKFVTRTASITFGAAAFIALVSTIAPASAQGVPAGLLRLDSSVALENSYAQATDLNQPKVRAAYASTRKHQKPAH